MLIDNKGKLFGKINVIDLIVIVLILAAIAGVGYKFTKSKSSVLAKTDKISLEFYTDEGPTYAAENVKVGDIVGDTQRDSTFGKVVDIKVDKAQSVGQTSSGQFVVASKPGLSSVHMQVYGEGILNAEGGMNINNINYYVGGTIILKAGSSTFVGRIYKMSKRG